jgi:glycosyltransferase involved in cell wall biosynthesis
MKVLTVVPDMGIGGTQRVAQNLSLGLSALGIEVAVLAHRGRGPREAAYLAAGLPIFAPSCGDANAGTAIEAAGRWAPDIVHIHRSGYPSTVETHLLRHLRSCGARAVETNVFARFDWTEGGSLIDAHCLLSKWCAFKWNAWGGRAARLKRSFILPNAVDAESIRPISDEQRRSVRASLDIPPDRFVFGRVGQPLMDKWSPAIFDAFQEVLVQHNLGLLLVGAPPEIMRSLAQLPEDVRARIVVAPVTTSDERLSLLIGAMDGFLHISAIGESFGMVLCEAMLGGIPVVTLSTPLRDNSQLEVVGHEKGGLVALTKEAVPTAMNHLINAKPLRDSVKAGGNSWVTSRFSVDVISRKAMNIYQAVLSDAPAIHRNGMDDPDGPPDHAWLRSVLSQGIGPEPGFSTALLFKLLHNPYLYRAYLISKLLLRGSY